MLKFLPFYKIIWDRIVLKSEYLLSATPEPVYEVNYPSQKLLDQKFLIDQEVIALELLKSGVYTTNWDNPELWVKLIIVVTALMLILAIMPLILSPKKTNIEKTTAYECGFAPFFIKEGIIEIQFVVVALLFLIFDLEVVYLVPIAMNVGIVGSHVISVFIIYIHLAWLMLAVEGFTGALSWPTWVSYTEIKRTKLRVKKNKHHKYLIYPYFVKPVVGEKMNTYSMVWGWR